MPERGAWILLFVCSLVGLTWAVRTLVARDYYASHAHWRDEPRAFVGASANAALLGLGTGMLVWFCVVVLAEVIARVTD